MGYLEVQIEIKDPGSRLMICVGAHAGKKYKNI
jgi:hypothetical protein